MRTGFLFGGVVLAMTLALAACVQVPPGTSSLGGRTGSVELPACQAAMTFAGIPRRVSAEVLRQMRESFGVYFKTEIDAWEYSQYRLQQTGACICRDAPFAEDEVTNEGLRNWTSKGGAEILGVGRGTVGHSQMAESAEPVRQHFQFIHVAAVPNCVLIQVVNAPPHNDGVEKLFFASPRSTVKADTSGASGPSAGVADRLRQIDQLLKDRLITKDEYDSRRRKILESL